jgi:uncharacterized protein
MPDKSKVYFIKLNEIDKLKNVFPDFQGKLGIKVHFGERGCETFVPAKIINEVTSLVDNANFIETSVLYKSPRRTAEGHKEVALEHGFDFIPIDFLDGEKGDDFIEQEINGDYFKKCFLGKNIENYQSLLILSHFKGHGGCGFGGAIKNLGMGLASRRGKLAMHASIKHTINKEKCIGCGECISHCPTKAIAFNSAKRAYIKENICISCSKCISVCPTSAVRIPWGSTGKKELNEKITEYAYASQLKRKCFFVNFLINITSDCDCNDIIMPVITSDIGVLASSDPLAIDQASYNLITKQCDEFKKDQVEFLFAYAEKIRLGSREYELIEL